MFNKAIHIVSLLVGSALLLTGCIKEKEKDCPTGNVTLVFSLLDENNAEVLKDRVENIDLVLFDGNGQYHIRHAIMTSSLDATRSMVLDLDPGIYSVVSWGNVNTNASICDLLNGMVADDGNLTLHSAETGDPLYYAASAELGLSRTINPGKALHTFEVPAEKSVTETLYFKHAHKLVDIYVQGYSVDGLLPILEVEGDHEGYDFYMNHIGENNITLRQYAGLSATPEGEMANAAFYTSRLRQENTIKINVLNPVTEQTVYTVDLNDVLDDFDLERQIRIPVLIEFFSGTFKVKLAEWLTTPSIPGLD